MIDRETDMWNGRTGREKDEKDEVLDVVAGERAKSPIT